MGFLRRLFGRRDSLSPPSEPSGSASSPGAPFRMVIEHVFAIHGRGTVVTGCIASGVVRKGDELVVRKTSGANVPVRCESVELALRADTRRCHPALMLSGVGVDDVESGDTICSPEPVPDAEEEGP